MNYTYYIDFLFLKIYEYLYIYFVFFKHICQILFDSYLLF